MTNKPSCDESITQIVLVQLGLSRSGRFCLAEEAYQVVGQEGRSYTICRGPQDYRRRLACWRVNAQIAEGNLQHLHPRPEYGARNLLAEHGRCFGAPQSFENLSLLIAAGAWVTPDNVGEAIDALMALIRKWSREQAAFYERVASTASEEGELATALVYTKSRYAAVPPASEDNGHTMQDDEASSAQASQDACAPGEPESPQGDSAGADKPLRKRRSGRGSTKLSPEEVARRNEWLKRPL